MKIHAWVIGFLICTPLLGIPLSRAAAQIDELENCCFGGEEYQIIPNSSGWSPKSVYSSVA